MKLGLMVALTVGTIVMLVIMLRCRRWLPLSKAKVAAFSVLLTVCGLTSTKIMYFIERGGWSGQSFFGAVFFVPVFLWLFARLLREKWTRLLDLSAPSICGMLAIMKVECFRSGCCKGRILYENAAGEGVRFPSQIVEMVAALVLLAVLMRFLRQPKNHGRIYPLFMLFYGTSRFFLNLLRETKPMVWILPAGNFWSLVAVAIGTAWLIILKHRERENLYE